MCRSELWVEFGRSEEKRKSGFVPLSREEVNLGHTPEVLIVSVWVARLSSSSVVDFSLLDRRVDRPDDLVRHLVLKLEDVCYSAIKTVSPQMCARSCVNQLASDPNAISILSDGAC